MAEINGTSGNDTLVGTADDDTLTGLAGNDLLTGDAGNDSLLGGEGSDTLVGGGGNDTLDGGTITDLVNYSDFNLASYSLSTAAVTVNLQTNTASDGYGGTDTLANINFVLGSGYNDSITGSDRSIFEQIEGGAGDDTLDGGTINVSDTNTYNRVTFHNATAGVVVNLQTGTATGTATGTDTLSNFNQARGSNFNDALTGDGNNNRLDGLNGDDLLIGAAGNDRLYGGNGQDTLNGGEGDDLLDGGGNDAGQIGDWVSYVDATGGVNVNLATGTATGGGGNDTLTGIEAVRGSTSDDTITGSSAAEWIQGNLGNDTLDGGGGFDFVDYGNATGAVTVSLASNTASGADGNDVLSNFEGIRGSVHADTLTGDANANYLRGGLGNDTLNGGDGFDTADYLAASAGVTVSLTTNTSSGADGADVLSNFEAIRGSNNADTLDGDTGNNNLLGMGGDDFLDGYAGNDTLDGGAGNDTVLGEAGNDYIIGGSGNDSLNGEDGYDTVAYNFSGATTAVNFTSTLGSGTQNDGLGGTDTVANFEEMHIFGGTVADTLTGGTERNWIMGNGGNDTLTGGDGIDSFAYNVAAASGTDRITDLASGENLSFQNQGGATFSLQATVLSGDDASALTKGQVMVGSFSGGVTKVYVGTDDTAGADLTVDLAGNYSAADFSVNNDAFGGNLQYSPGQTVGGTAGNDTLNGSSGADTIDGAGGNDFINGQGGADSVQGGLGDDYIIAGGDGANDTIDGGDGFDVVSNNFNSQTNPVTFTSAGTAGPQADGLGGTDTLSNVEEIQVFGGSAGDTLTGDAGRNYMMGNGGNDTLTGGGGNDSFAYDLAVASGVDRITDMNGNDNLQFTGAVLNTTIQSGNDASALAQGHVMIGTPAGGVTTVYVGTATLGAPLVIELQGSFVAANFSVNNDAFGGNLVMNPFITLTGTGGNDTLTGTGADEILDGQGGNDLLVGMGGNDSLLGGAGSDTLAGGGGNDTMDGGTIVDTLNYTDLNVASYSASTSGVNVNLQTGTASDGFGGTDTLVNLNFVLGSAHNDTLTGSNGPLFEQFEGGLGDDVIDGGTIDTVTQANGNRVTYVNASAAVQVDLSQNKATGAAGNDTLTNINNVRGSNFNDSLTGSDTTAYVEVFDGRGGNDTIDGAGGIDQVRYDTGSTTSVTVNLATQSATDNQGGTDVLLNIENVRGSNSADSITGDANANYLEGLGGHDVMDAGDGNDNLVGGEGDDTLTGGSGIDIFRYGPSGNGVDTITDFGIGDIVGIGASLTNGVATTGDGSTVLNGVQVSSNGTTTTLYIDTNGVAGAETQINLTGDIAASEFTVTNLGNGISTITRAAGQTLTGDAGNNTITGNLGSDTLSGLDGDDLLNGAGGDDSLSGGNGADMLEGADGADNLQGDAGNDMLHGGPGNDTLDGGADTDTATYWDATTGVVTNLGSNTSTDGLGGTDTLLNVENVVGSSHSDNLTGNSAGNVLTGDTGADTLNGAGGNDTLYGGGWNDLLIGGEGDDLLDGGTEIDTVSYGDATGGVNINLGAGSATGMGNDTLAGIEQARGGVHADTITGDGSSNVLMGDAGNDTIDGANGSDTLQGDDGDDSLLGGEGFDVLVGGAGNDTLNGGADIDMADYSSATGGVQVSLEAGTATDAAGNDTLQFIENLLGSQHADTLTGDFNNNYLAGNAGNDTLLGGDGNDDLNGGDGDDSLSGGTGGDLLRGGAGNDALDGGADQDRVSYDDATSGVTVNLGTGSATGAAIGTDTLSGIEDVTGSDQADSITGDSGANALEGRAGNDTLAGEGGNDFISGGDGTDLLQGGAGFDVLRGGAGGDTLDGGADVDEADYSDAVNSVTASLAGGTATVAGDDADSLSGIENLRGSAYDDSLAGDTGANTLSGGSGNDTLSGGDGNDNLRGDAGDDVLNGGAGNDYINAGGSGDGGNDTVDGGDGYDVVAFNYGGEGSGVTFTSTGPNGTQVDPLGGTHTLSNVEEIHIIGGSGADTLTGDSGRNWIQGNAGDDTLTGGGGNDTFSYSTQGSGIDRITDLNAGDNLAFGNPGGAVPVLSSTILSGNDASGLTKGQVMVGTPGGGVTRIYVGTDDTAGADIEIDLAGTYTAGEFSVANDSFNGYLNYTPALNLTGTAGDDSLTGGSGNDTLDGLGGNDLLVGLGGNDSLLGGAGSDTLAGGGGNDTLDGGTITDTVFLSDLNVVSYSASTSGVNVNLQTGTASDGFGGTDSLSNLNFVVGSIHNDTLTGSNSQIFEQFEGGLGDDVIDGGTIDTVTQANGNRVTYQNASGAVQVDLSQNKATGAAGADTLTNINNVRGSNFNDSLTGSDTTAYVEVFDGRGGNDVIDGKGGIDMVRFDSAATTGVTVDLSANTASNDGQGGTDTITNVEYVRGSGFNDSITGDANANLLEGQGGDDAMAGGDGNDTLTGGTGNDTLTGGNGNDLFRFGPSGNGVDTITDFASGDVIGVGYGLTGGTATAGDGSTVTNGGVQVASSGGTTTLYIDTNNTAGAEVQINVAGTFAATAFTVTNNGNGTSSITLNNNQLVTGTSGNDNLSGGPGNDTINGLEGNDYITAGGDGASDTVDGGDGHDIYSNNFFSQTGGVTFTSTGPSGTQVDPTGGTDTISNVEEFHIFGGSGADSLTGDSGRNWIQGNGGNDTLTGSGGNDSFAFNVANAVGTDLITDLASGENLAFQRPGGALFALAGPVLTGDDASGLTAGQVMVGTPSGGVTRIHVGVDGTAGADITVDLQGTFTASDFSVMNDAFGGNLLYVPGQTLTGTGANETLTGAQGNDTISGLGGSDVINGNDGNDSLLGGDGDDLISGGLGNDTIDGGAGNDWAFHDAATSGVTVNLGTGSVTGGAGTDSLSGIEWVGGSVHDDSLTGDGNANVLQGRAGNDTLDGAGGTDTADYYHATTGVTASLASNTATGEGNDTFISIENLNGSLHADTLTGDGNSNSLFGAAGNDTLDGGAGNDYLDGFDGNDSIFGGTGADTLHGGAGNDTLDGGTIADTVNLSDLNVVTYFSATTGVNVNLQTGTASDGLGGTDTLANINFVNGSNHNDTITGSNSQIFEQFDGDLGDDVIDGGTIDTVTQANGNRVTYQNASGAVQVDLGQNKATGAAGNDTLTNINNVRGSNAGDVLTGSNATGYVEVFDGRGGNDTIDGAGGIDMVRFDSASTTGVTVNLSTNSATDGQGGTDTITNVENVRGSQYSDSITGDGNANLLEGQGGDDAMAGGDGNDTLTGGAGNDTLSGGSGNDLFRFGPGGNDVDTITDFASGDVIGIGYGLTAGAATAGDGSTVTNGGVQVSSSGGTTTLWIDTNNTAGAEVQINLAGTYAATAFTVTNHGNGTSSITLSNDQTITGTGANETLSGAEGNDTISGLGGNDVISGNDGNDSLLGGDGDDFMNGGLGNDYIDGGAGNDWAFHDAATSAVTVNLGTGSVSGGAGNDTLTGIEWVGGSVYDDSLTGDGNANVLQGRAGNDTLDGAGGTDTADYYHATTGVTASLATNTATGEGTDTFISIENLNGSLHADTLTGDGNNNSLFGAAGNDTLDGGAGNDYLDGFDGDDNLQGGAGADTLHGGAGNDTLDGGTITDTVNYADSNVATYFSATRGVNVNLLINTAQDGLGGTDTLSNINIVIGSNHNDTITGTNWQLFEQFDGGLGDDTIDGGAIDTVTLANPNRVAYVGATGAVQVDLGLNKATGAAGNDTLLNINQVRGSNFDDNLKGSDATAYVEVFDGRGGNDTIDGAGGIDQVRYDTGATTAVTVNLATNSATDNQGGTDTLYNIENVRGSNSADSITGDANANALEGIGGNDTLIGGDGNDTLTGGAGDDNLTGGTGVDLFRFADSGNGVDTITDFGVADFIGIGAVLASGVATAGDGSTVAFGGVQVSSSGGVTTLWIDTDNEAGAEVQINLTGTFAANAFVATDLGNGTSSIAMAGDLNLGGTAGNDLLTGGIGADTLNGSAGNDTLDGGAGVDVVSYAGATAGVNVQLWADQAVNDGQGGTDVLLNIENVVGSGLNDLLVGDELANTLDGGAGGDTLVGAEGNDVLLGGDGDDDLIGGDGADTLTGGAGNDTLQGGAGIDTFVLDGTSQDVVYDFTAGAGGDVLDLSGISLSNYGGGNVFNTGHARLVQTGANLLLQVDADGTGAGAFQTALVLAGVQAGNLTAANFAGGANPNVALTLSGTAGADQLVGGTANDTLNGSAGNDTLDGGAGVDVVSYAGATAGVNVQLWADQAVNDGQGGTDVLLNIENVVGSGLNDLLVGDELANTLDGGAGGDTLVGAEGNDVLLGGDGADDLIGGDGADTLTGGAGNDTLQGGAGIDTFVLDGTSQDVVYDFTAGAGGDVLDLSGISLSNYGGGNVFNTGHARLVQTGANLLLQVDADGTGAGAFQTALVLAGVQAGNLTAANFAGGANPNVALTLSGTAGADQLVGGTANDTLNGSAGNDTLDGGAGVDVVSYAGATAGVNVQLWADQAVNDGQGGSDVLLNIENVVGSGFNDLLVGDEAANTLDGGAGSDTLVGAEGNDVLLGGDGADDLIGGDGADTLTGGAGNDTLQGGAGADTFVLDGASQDVVYDFTAGAGGDVLDLTGITLTNYGGGNVFNTGHARLVQTGGNLLLQVDADGTGAGAFQTALVLAGVQAGNLTAANFAGGANPNVALTLSGTAGADQLVGGTANDTLNGSAGNDTLDGGAGVDVVSYAGATAGVNVQLWADQAVNDGQGGTDVLLNIENVVGSGLNDLLVGDELANTLDGGAGGDTLVGAEGNDVLLGGDGADDLIGGDGADTLTGGAGNDTLQGGAGIDTFVLDGTSQDVVYDFTAGAGGDVLDLSGISLSNYGGGNVFNTGHARLVQTGGNLLLQVDADGTGAGAFQTALVLAGVQAGNLTAANFAGGANPNVALTLSGTAGADQLVGGTANDTLNGSAGNDTLDGGAGVDVVSYAGATAGVNVQLWADQAVNDGQGGTDVLLNIENVVGSGLNDLLVGDELANTLDGGAGGDTLVGAEGNDVLLGGDGDDDLIGGDGADTLTGGAGNDTLQGGAGIDTFVLDGTSQDVVYDFTAGAGGDVLDLSGISLSNYGGGNVFNTGHARLVQTGANLLLQVDADGTGAGAFQTALVLAGVQAGNLTAANFAGGANPNVALTLSGTAGADQLVGGTANDTLNGSAGNDTLDGGAGVDVVSYAGATAGVNVQLWADQAVNDGQGGTDVLLNIENVVGSGLNDLLVGDELANTLDGGAGGDTLVGAEGNDVLLGGDGDDDLIGGDGADTLTGGAGNDTLQGGAGIDTFVLDGTSQDVVYDFTAGAGGDVLDLSGISLSNYGGGNVFNTGHARLVQTGANLLLQVDADGTGAGAFQTALVLAGVQAGNLTAANFAGGANPNVALTLSGTAGADQLVGGTANDTLNGSAGNDTLDGGAGVDVVSYAGATAGVNVQLWADQAVNDGQGGTDVLLNIENVVGSGLNDLLVGDELANTLDGGAGGDTLVGAEGNDVLLGGDGDDLMYGNDGDDTLGGGNGVDGLIGGAGSDVFDFQAASAFDWVEDFVVGTDKIRLVSGMNGSSNTSGAAVLANTTDVNGNAIIDLGGGNTLALIGVTKASLSAGDFLFL